MNSGTKEVLLGIQHAVGIRRPYFDVRRSYFDARRPYFDAEDHTLMPEDYILMSAQHTSSLFANCVQSMCNIFRNYVQTMFKMCANCVQTMCELCGKCVCANYCKAYVIYEQTSCDHYMQTIYTRFANYVHTVLSGNGSKAGGTLFPPSLAPSFPTNESPTGGEIE